MPHLNHMPTQAVAQASFRGPQPTGCRCRWERGLQPASPNENGMRRTNPRRLVVRELKRRERRAPLPPPWRCTAPEVCATKPGRDSLSPQRGEGRGEGCESPRCSLAMQALDSSPRPSPRSRRRGSASWPPSWIWLPTALLSLRPIRGEDTLKSALEPWSAADQRWLLRPETGCGPNGTARGRSPAAAHARTRSGVGRTAGAFRVGAAATGDRSRAVQT